jgi:hypothetical protein
VTVAQAEACASEASEDSYRLSDSALEKKLAYRLGAVFQCGLFLLGFQIMLKAAAA